LQYGLRERGSTLITGSEIGLYVQRRVQTYPHSRQTPDFGTFAFDDRGEMVISLAAEADHATAAIIGRTEDNDIAINHHSISRNHAKLTREPETGRYTISDLQSSNGVRVNGSDYGKVELRRGDVVDLGHVRLRFVEAGEDFVFARDAVISDVPGTDEHRRKIHPAPRGRRVRRRHHRRSHAVRAASRELAELEFSVAAGITGSPKKAESRAGGSAGSRWG
jgi:hypothetical protein